MSQSTQAKSDNPKNNTAKNARNNILAKLKKEVKGADYTKLPKEACFQYPEISKEAQRQQLVTLLENNHAEVIKLAECDITNTVNEILNKRNINALLIGQSAQCNAKELTSKLDKSITVNSYDFSLFTDQATKNNLFNHTPASLTHSHCAIAATGSIVLWPTVEEPRSLSLVPPLHIVIVDAQKIYQDFASLIKCQQWQTKMPTNIVLVSGPSKTADIQQTLAYGAHGPKELIVLLLNSEG